MSAKTSTSPGTDARSDSVRRGGYAAGDNSSSSNKDRKAQTDSGSSSRQTAVYGPELPPSMLRSKVDSAAAGITDISNPPNFIDIAKFLREESRNEHSKSDYMRRTENELQTLFYSHLKSIMDRHGYKGKYFKEQDVARVMVDTGLMSSLSDDPALALASDLKARMISIVHKNMRQMASSVMVPEFFEDMAVDPMVIDTLVDMSRQSPSGSKQAASVVAFAAAAAVAEADADFENALKALDTMTLVESFHLDELCRNQQNPALAASHLAATDPELRPPSKPASTPSSSSTTAPASKLTSESASASASKSASKSPSTESGQAAAAQTKATHTAPSIPLLNASLKELAAKTEEMQTKSSQLFDNMDYSTAVEAQAVNAASARNAGLSSSMLPSRAQIKRSRKRLKGKERETTVAANGDAKSRRAPLPETQQPRLSANKKVSQPASGGSKQRPLGHQPVLPPSDSLCQSFLSSSASRPGPVHESLDQSKKPSDQAEKLWSSDSADEHKQVRTFWLSLSDIERQALILVEKEVVLARVRDHQNFSCSCNICSRKREAIEQELDFLYDCYYEELQERVCRGRVRMAIRKMEPIAKANIMSSVEAVVDTAMSNLVASSNGLSKTDLQTAIIKSIKQAKLTSAQANPDNRGPTDIGTFLMRAMTASVLENLSSKDSAAKEKNEHNRDAAIEGAVQAIRSWVSGTLELNKDSSDDMVPSDAESEEILNNNDLFYTENMLDTIGTFPTDSKKFFDMMERLAEYRMRREEVTIEDINDHERAFFANAAPSDKPPLKDRESMTHSWVRRARDSSHRQRHCPDCHGEISESEEQAGDLSNLPNTNLALSAAAKSLLDTDLCYATDSEYEDIDEDGDAIGVFARTSDRVEDTGFYSSDSQDHDCEETNDEDDEDDDEDEDLCDTDEDLDDLDDLDSEYAEREAEEGRKVFQLFAARLFEQRVINTYREKIARERQQNLIKELEDEEKEQQAKEKRKQKKREREKERKKQLQLRKEQERQAKEAALKIEQERKREAEQKRYDEMMQKRREQELKTKKALEERNKRILEEADRRMEREKLQKQRAEEERLQKEQERVNKAREEELLQQQQQQQQQKQKQQRQKQRQKLKEKASTSNSSLQTHPSSPVSPKTTTAAATMPKVSADACSSKRALFSTPDEALKTPPATARPAPTPVTAQATVAAGSPSFTGLAYGSAPISASVQLSSVVQQPLFLPIPKPAGMPNGVLAEPSLLASSIGASMLQPPSPSPGSLKISRPSLPLINPFDLGSVSPTTPSFGMPGRMRANSGSGIYHSFLPTSVPVQTAANHAVSPEIDAEISSIVGRVMGSCTLQDDLISGAEWRTEPLDAFTPDHSSLSMSAASLGMGIGMGVDAPFGDISARRNSMPHSRAASNVSALGNVEAHIRSGSRAAGARFNAPPEMSREIDSIHSAYCALERFRRDTRTISAATLGNEAAFGGFHSVAELAKMHGRMSEPDIWAICSTSAQTNPGFCRVNHATHAVAFARTGISGGGLGMSSSTPMAMDGLSSVSDSLGSGNVGNGNSTPLNHLAAIAEDMMSAFSLQPQAGNDSSPLLANSFPLNMSPSYAQSRSPLVLASQSQSQTQLRPHQLGPASRVPIMTAPMAMPGSGLKQQQQQISPSIPMSHAGLGFSPLVHQGPSAPMFFNPMSMHTPPATSSLMPPPFQQQMPTGSWSPSKPHLASAVSSVAGSDMMQQTAPLGSVPAQLRQVHMFQPSAQQHFPH